MKLHANAPLGPKGRALMVRRVVDQGWSLTEAAEAAAVSERTCAKWVERYRREGEAGLLDRSSAPRRIANRTPEDRVQAIAALRQSPGTHLAPGEGPVRAWASREPARWSGASSPGRSSYCAQARES